MANQQRRPLVQLPPETIRELKASDENIQRLKEDVKAIEDAGFDVTPLREILSRVEKMNKVLLERFG